MIDAQGWLHTGDLGVLHVDGYLQIIGRYKDQLRVGGENVDPSEVEAFFLEQSAILDALGVGIPDERLGEVACLCIIAGDNLSADAAQQLLSLADGRSSRDVQTSASRRSVRLVPDDRDRKS